MSSRLGVAVVVAGLAGAGCGSSAPIVTDAGGGDASVPDVTTVDAPVEAPDTCADGVKDGKETDVDCGGTCAPCSDGRACTVASDCASNRCSGGTCGLRAWFVESSGDNLPIPGDQTWVDTSPSGLILTPTLYAPSLVFLRWTGTLRFGGGGNGLCHVGQRFVIDDVPTGDATWGDSIMVEDGATRWHENFTTEMAVPLGLGIHKIAVAMTNAQGYATCYLDGDGGLAYDRSRLAVAAFDPKNAWYAESTAEASVIGSSTFVDIPGVSVSIDLATARHVQVSLTGTQLAQGVTPGVGTASCAYRLVVDGTPLGDPTYGQAISIGDVARGWWAPVSLKYGEDLPAGAHTIAAQLSNTSSQATCYADQGNNPYARFRMFVTSTPTGGPNTSVESTGGPNILGSLSGWTDIGLSATFTVSAPSPAQLEMSATERTMSGSGHCAWRFLIDGAPLGDVNHGQAINVGSGSATWWTETSLLWGQTFDAGSHTVSVQVANSSNGGDCGTNGDGLPYGRARLLVRVP